MKTSEPFQHTIPAVFECIEDALKDVVRALGGTKKVAPMLWPASAQESPLQAEKKLMDCLNPERPHKLSPSEVITLARWGREVGCHSLAAFFNERAGYGAPIAISPEDEKAELERKTIEAIGYLRHLVERAEAVHGKKS